MHNYICARCVRSHRRSVVTIADVSIRSRYHNTSRSPFRDVSKFYAHDNEMVRFRFESITNSKLTPPRHLFHPASNRSSTSC